MNAGDPVLEADQIGRRIGETERWLLRGIALRVMAGERLVVVGSSGSGKTLLLRALVLMDPLDEGRVRWHGEAVGGDRIPAFRSNVIYLHQRPPLMEGLVEDNLRLPFSFRIHRHRRFQRDQIEQWLLLLGRDVGFLKKASRDLSGGEAQITALLRAIQLEPEVLLLDEPTAALDQHATHAMESVVQRWQQQQPERRTLVLVTHDAQQARRLAARTVQMKDGKIMNGA